MIITSHSTPNIALARAVRLTLLTTLLLSSYASAHVETDSASGLVSGLLHPVMGPDHLVAMVAVGMWGAQLGAPALWVLPIVFPLVMAVGALLGLVGVPLPFIEIGIAISALLLGMAVALQFRASLAVTAVLVGAFAVFHGHAHGTELPASANALAYGIGFVISTGLLHLGGILIGALIRWPTGAVVVRACGGVVALTGVYFLLASTSAQI